MFDSKISDTIWKDILAKNKGVKDNGLQKLLADAKKVREEDHDAAQKLVEEILKLVAQLKKVKEVSAIPVAGKFLTDLGNAADTATRNIAKGKAEAQKNAKAQAEAAKKQEKDAAKDHGEESEGQESALLTTLMTPLLREVSQGHRLFTLIATNGKDTAVMLSRKEIPHTRRKMLADYLGVSGGLKYLDGHCFKEENVTTFALNHEVAGMTKKLKAALLAQTGRRVKLRCRGHDGQTDEDDEGDDAPAGTDADDDDTDDSDQTTGRGRADAQDDDDDDDDDDDQGDSGGDAPAAVAPPPTPARAPAGAPTLAQSPQLWNGARQLVAKAVDDVRSTVHGLLDGEDAAFAKQAKDNLQKLDRILASLDKRLSDSLTKAAAAQDASGRADALKNSKAILGDYIRYVRSEPLIAHLDNNPFGVKTNLKVTLTNGLTQIAKAIG